MEEDQRVVQQLHLRSGGVHGKMNYDERYTKHIRQTGLLPFISLVSRSTLKMDPCLITALVDRWCPETHSFHFHCGEMTVTLQDVSMILALPIKGAPICFSTDTKGWRDTMKGLIGTEPGPQKMSAGDVGTTLRVPYIGLPYSGSRRAASRITRSKGPGPAGPEGPASKGCR